MVLVELIMFILMLHNQVPGTITYHDGWNKMVR